MTLYNQFLTDHYRNPRNKGLLESPNFDTRSHNPSCGDRVRMQGVLEDNMLAAVKFNGSGCVLSQAAASVLAEYVQGKSVDEILLLDKNKFVSMLSITVGPTRLACIVLSLDALHDGIQMIYSEERKDDAQQRKSSKKASGD